MANNDQELDNSIHELLGEIMDLAPKEISTMTTTDSGQDVFDPADQATSDRRAWFALAAVFALAIAGASVWVVSRDSSIIETTTPAIDDSVSPTTDNPNQGTVDDAVPVEASAYRYVVVELNGGLTAEGIVDPETSRASISIEPFGIEAFTDGETVTASDGFTFSGPNELTLFFADRTRTMALIEETFTVGEWTEIGPATVNDVETIEFQAPVSADFGEEIFITDSVIGFFELFSAWEGTIQVFVRENGLVSQLNLSITEEAGYSESLQLDYFDIEGPVEFN